MTEKASMGANALITLMSAKLKKQEKKSCSPLESFIKLQAETFNFSLKYSRFIQMNLSSLFILHYLAHLLLRNLNSFDLSKDVNSPC